MQYLGGKFSLVKKFAPVLAEALDRNNGRFYEPFVGGFNLVPALKGSISEAFCSDIHPGLINLYKALQNGWRPPTEVTPWLYEQLKKRRGMDPLSVFASFACSFGGKEWDVYAKARRDCNYAAAGARSITRKFTDLPSVEFLNSPYLDLHIEAPSVVYCDPPYRGTVAYKTGHFDHNEFDAWCESLVLAGNEVYVSEFNAPSHWSVVWLKQRKVTVAMKRYKTETDKLFRVVPRETS